MIPTFDLLRPAHDVTLPGELVDDAAHDKAAGARTLIYEIAEGRVLLTIWKDRLHEVIYQTPVASASGAHRRNNQLFEHYGAGQPWKEMLDNGFGKTYRRADMERYALWSYAMDFTTFGTMEFHAVKW